jgi:tRNA pseudouridine13 synthase
MTGARRTPHIPSFCTADLTPIGGRLSDRPEDFVVDEVLPFEPSGSGEHFLVRVCKRGFTTQDAVRLIARAAGVGANEIGSAGMKDKHAITTQWLSTPARGVPPEGWDLPDGLTLVQWAPHNRKLRTGQQLGNRFTIELVGVSEDALARASAICSRLESEGLPNYFGEQRFGRGGDNLEQAFRWLTTGPVRGRQAHFYQKLYPSVLQSEVFNRYVSRRRELGMGHLLQGEVVRLQGTAAMFVVEDPSAELPRLTARDIHPTGPLPGPKIKPASGEAEQLEREILEDVGLGESELTRLGDAAPGARRDVMIYPGPIELAQPAEGRLRLSFYLPSGSFATQLVRELTRAAWLEERRPTTSIQQPSPSDSAPEPSEADPVPAP